MRAEDMPVEATPDTNVPVEGGAGDENKETPTEGGEQQIGHLN